MLPKPPEHCSSCSLWQGGNGYVPADGAENAPLLVLGEAAGREEQAGGKGFIGPSGQFHWRWAQRSGFRRDDCRVGNVCACRPFTDHEGNDTPPPLTAVNQCAWQREPLFREPHRAILTLGIPATRAACKFFGYDFADEKGTWLMDNLHGYVIGDGSHPYIIPSYHPSFVMQWSKRHTGIYRHDISRAWEVASQGFIRSDHELIADPPPDWFSQWADTIGPDDWVAYDIETPRSEGDADDLSDPCWRLLYINLASNKGQGVSVPAQGSYLSVVKRLLQRVKWLWAWYKRYDFPRTARWFGWSEGTAEYSNLYSHFYDTRDAWHVLQSDMGGDDKDERDKSAKGTVKGNSLGFVAPLYSDLPPWKHLGSLDPVYRPMDGIQTIRVAHGVAADLMKQGQWDVFLRHCHQRDVLCLRPATDMGLNIDEPALNHFEAVVKARQVEVVAELQGLFPEECLPLSTPRATPLEGDSWPALPSDGSWAYLSSESGPGSRLARLEPIVVGVCEVCGSFPVAISHNCAPKAKKGEKRGKSQVVKREQMVPRYYTRLEFNPDSPDQIRSYLALKGLKTGKAKKAKTDKQTTNKQALAKLSAKDPFFAKAGEQRKLTDILGDYVDATRRYMRFDGRIHPEFIHKPSTMRDSSIRPNAQQVVHGDEEALDDKPWDAAGYRKCVVASPGCELWEIDYSAIEGLTTGWCTGDPDYIRIARAGVHSYLTGYAVDPSGVPPRDKLRDVSEEELKRLLKPFKKHKLYAVKKKTVHRVSYGSSARGMRMDNPEIYTSVKMAEEELAFFASLCPKTFPWQNELRNVAARQNYLGGGAPIQRDAFGGITIGGHPFGYRHWFFAVVRWDAKKGEMVPDSKGDGNRVVAFYPQSIAAGIKAEAELELHDPDSPYFIGDFYMGRTPFRAPIHDSGLYDVPISKREQFHERVVAAMTAPVIQLPCPEEWGMGPFLSIGVAVKRGPTWGDMEEV